MKACKRCQDEIHEKKNVKYCPPCREIVSDENTRRSNDRNNKRAKEQRAGSIPYATLCKKPNTDSEPKNRLERESYYEGRDTSLDGSGYY